MSRFINAGVIILLFSGLLTGCEDDEATPEIQHPVAGVYTLTEMTINVEATTLGDTSVTLIVPQNDTSEVHIPAGALILTESTLYTDSDETPIGGTVTLSNDLSGNLHGFLPINWGTGCNPILSIDELGSDGTWSADTSTGIFALDLVFDQLDIDGFFTLNGDQLEVTYLAHDGHDERTISSISYMGAPTAVEPVCIPVSTTTERIMKLTLD